MTHARRCLGCAAVAGVVGLFALLAPKAGTAATFAQRTVVTIDHTRVPDGDGLPLTNFPVLVSVQNNALRTTATGGLVTSSRGYDILFQGEDAPTCGGPSTCRLDHEIESYDGTTGTIVAWVRVPGTIFDASDGANTPIYMYYGDATITCSQENKAGVWDASYREVFHLHEAGDHTDSTNNAFTAAGKGSVTNAVTGRVGPAVALASTVTPGSINISDGTIPTATSLTLEAWVKADIYVVGSYVGLFVKGREALNFDGDPDPSAGFCTMPPCGDWVGLYNLDSGLGYNVFSFGWASGNACKLSNLDDPRPQGSSEVQSGVWYHLAATYDQAAHVRRFYVNGAEVANDAGVATACLEAAIPQYGRLGTDSNGNSLNGQLDEVRMSFAVRSADWIGTGYNNQNAPYVGAGGFYSSVAHQPGPYAGVGATACPARNPCAGGPGTCNLRSIGNTAAYSTGSGTCTATNGSSVVSCPGAGWQSANRGRGDRITIDGTDYQVLAVDSETQLRLRTPFTGTTGVGNKAYVMSRQFATMQAWEDCISTGGGACPYFTVADGNLVTGNRSEIGIAYEGTVFTGAGVNPILDIDGSTTDAAHTITLTADGSNRHFGLSNTGVVVNNGANSTRAIVIQDQFVTVEWLEVQDGVGASATCIDYVPANAANHAVIRNNLIKNCGSQSIRLSGPSTVFVADINNNVIYRGAREGIRVDSVLGTGTGSQVRIFNNTLLRNNANTAQPWTEISTAERPNPYVVLRNNILVDDVQAPDATWNGSALCTNAANCDWWNAASGNNIVGDAAPWGVPANWQADIGPNPRGAGVASATEASLSFVNTTATSENLHIQSGSSAWNAGSNLTGFVFGDIDAVGRSAPWDVGADELAPARRAAARSSTATTQRRLRAPALHDLPGGGVDRARTGGPPRAVPDGRRLAAVQQGGPHGAERAAARRRGLRRDRRRRTAARAAGRRSGTGRTG